MIKPLSQITFDFVATEKAAEELSPTQPISISSTPPALKKEKKKPRPQANSNGKRGRRSLKEGEIQSDLVSIPEDEKLFSKQYYSIGEVAGMFHENQSLIRYWETEFDILQPKKNRKGDRFFRPVDIKNLVMIHDLLRRRKFTIEGAKEYLKKNNKVEEKFELIQSLQRIRSFLLELKASL